MLGDLDTFVTALTGWHVHKVAALQHMMEIPEGTEVTLDEETPSILTGDLLKGFQLGIQLSLLELGTLPFIAEEEPISI